MDWQEVERVAKECQRTWGMGFPCISLKLLEPYRATLEAALAEKEREGVAMRLGLYAFVFDRDYMLEPFSTPEWQTLVSLLDSLTQTTEVADD